MNKETMTAHKALSELKVLDKRIAEKINSLVVCGTNKHSNIKVNGLTIDEHKANMQESYQSVTDLIKRRNAIKTALSNANATTKITVNGIEYTLAQAIEMKRSGIEHSKAVLNRIARQYEQCKNNILVTEQDVVKRAEQYVVQLFGTKDKSSSSDAQTAYDVYVKQNSLDYVEGINCLEEMKTLEEFVSKFESEVDSAISVSNATTIVEVEY
jgi:hypothetical protein